MNNKGIVLSSLVYALLIFFFLLLLSLLTILWYRQMAMDSMRDDAEDIYADGNVSAEYASEKGVNRPKLVTGMTPIKWNGSSWVDTTADDSSWYNYSSTDKRWANARTADGSMWVWIPRYVYRISSNWHNSANGTIDVQFSMGTDDTRGETVDLDVGTTSNSSNNKWTTHPGFTFGGAELTGIWVAKFEATAVEGVANGYVADLSCPTTGDNVATKTIKIVPNVQSWRCQTASNAFTASRNMETKSVYGWGTSGTGIDTHLIKNGEWGAIAYLSQSVYGKNTEITINNNSNYYTGGGTSNAYVSNTAQSSTGTIYGIYDLSGGAWERVAAYLNNGTANLTNGSSIISASAKYKDVYTVGTTDTQINNYNLTINHKGDAVYETGNNINGMYSWYADYAFMPNDVAPWFLRGDCFNAGVYAGMFMFYGATGAAGSDGGFRPVLVISSGI